MLRAAQFQRRFALAVMGRRTPGPFRAPGFAVYRNTWVKALLEALEANYPVIAALLGPQAFGYISIEYARIERSASPALALYGHKFADYLTGHALSEELPYLPDVARLESLWTECLFAPDAEPIDLNAIANGSVASALDLRLKLHPAARVARFDTPAVTIWQAHRNDPDFALLQPEWKAEQALVVRRGASVDVEQIDDRAFALLSALQRGRSLGQALEHVASDDPHADLSPVLRAIGDSGALTVDIPTDMQR